MADGDVKIYIDSEGVIMEVAGMKVWCSSIACAEWLGLVFNLTQRAAEDNVRIAFVADQWTKVVEN